MRFNKLDLNLLVALDALLTERNITRAAERVHLSQSAMSNALSRLREYFEDDLLVQVGRKMEPTPRAQTLQEAVRDVLLRIDTSIAAVPQFDGSSSDREFILFVSDYTMAVFMPHALALAARQRSTVRFKLLPQVASPARSLERGEADLLIIPKAYCSTDHPAEVVFEEEHVCVVWSESIAQRVAVGRRLGDRPCGQHAAGARPVLQHQRLLQIVAHGAGDDAHGDVRRRAGTDREHDLDRPVGIARLRMAGRAWRKTERRDAGAQPAQTTRPHRVASTMVFTRRPRPLISISTTSPGRSKYFSGCGMPLATPAGLPVRKMSPACSGMRE